MRLAAQPIDGRHWGYALVGARFCCLSKVSLSKLLNHANSSMASLGQFSNWRVLAQICAHTRLAMVAGAATRVGDFFAPGQHRHRVVCGANSAIWSRRIRLTHELLALALAVAPLPRLRVGIGAQKRATHKKRHCQPLVHVR